MGAGEIVTIRTATANCYLVTGEVPYLVDTNVPKARRKVLAALSAHGLSAGDLRYILITHYHYDHTGCLAEMRGLSGARVAAGERDAAVIRGESPQRGPGDISPAGRMLRKVPASLLEKYQHFEPCEVDMTLRDGDRIEELGLEVLELPGHTEGGVAYYLREKKLAFIGDLVSNFFHRPGPPFLSFSYDKEAILQSVRRLGDLDLEYAYPGHGAVIGPGAAKKIRALAERLASRWGLA